MNKIENSVNQCNEVANTFINEGSNGRKCQKEGMSFCLLVWGSVFLGLSMSFSGWAQKPTWDKQELESVEIEIVNERQITLPKANRNFEKIPPRPSEPIKPPVTYDFPALQFNTPAVKPLIRPLKLKRETPALIHKGQLSAGYGNYATPFLEGYYNAGQNKNNQAGIHGWFNRSFSGPVDGKNSGGGNAGIAMHGRTYGKGIVLGGNAGYENRSAHFYGYPSSKKAVKEDTIRQAFSTINLGAFFENVRNSRFKYKVHGDFSHLSDSYNAKETEAGIGLLTSYSFSEVNKAELTASYVQINRKDTQVQAVPRDLLTIKASYTFKALEELRIQIGAIGTFENDSMDSKNLHFYPDLKANYKLSPSVELTGSFSGGIDKVSLHVLSRENMWLSPNVPLLHTNRQMETEGGLKAKLGNKISFHTGLAIASLKNWYFYLNDSSDQARFLTVYDRRATKRSNFFASLAYTQGEKAKFMFRGDVYDYITDELQEAWHRPDYKLAVNGAYNVFGKVLLSADLMVQGGLKAYDFNTKKSQTLATAVDLNAKIEYLFSPSFSVFAKGQNLLNTVYPLYYNYPVRGILVMGGFVWNF